MTGNDPKGNKKIDHFATDGLEGVPDSGHRPIGGRILAPEAGHEEEDGIGLAPICGTH